MINKDNLDLETLEYIKFHFGLYSDHSTKSHGYKWLCKLIDEVNKLPETNKFNNNLQAMLNICPECGGIMQNSSFNNMQCRKCGYYIANI